MASGALGGARAIRLRRIALRLAGRFATPAIECGVIDLPEAVDGSNEPFVPADAAGILDGSPRTSLGFGVAAAACSWARDATSRWCGRGGFCSLIGFEGAGAALMTIFGACGVGAEASPQPYSTSPLRTSESATSTWRRAPARRSRRRRVGSIGRDCPATAGARVRGLPGAGRPGGYRVKRAMRLALTVAHATDGLYPPSQATRGG